MNLPRALAALSLLAMVGALGCRPAGATSGGGTPLPPPEAPSAFLRAAVAECERIYPVPTWEASFLDGAVHVRCQPIADRLGVSRPAGRKGPRG